MWNFLKKDILVLVRDKTELAVLLLMPLILTAILGFALGGLMSGDTSSLNLKMAVVQEDEPTQGVEKFLNEVESLSVPAQAKEQMTQAAESFKPVTIINEILQSEELSETIQVTYLSLSEAERALEEEEVAAIMSIPQGFTYDTLSKMVFDQGSGGLIVVESGSHSSTSASILEGLMDSIIQQMNLNTAIAKAAGPEAVTVTNSDSIQSHGGVESVSDKDPITSIQYYAFAMAVMFGLFTASTMAGKAHVENFQNVFNRILLTGKSPYVYLSGKGISTTIAVMMQIVILLLVVRVAMQSLSLTLVEWFGILLITLFFSLSIGAIGVLLASITLRANSDSIPGIFSGGFVSIFALIGGSFAPKMVLPDAMNQLGEWTPNGIALTAYLQWSQGLGMDFIFDSLVKLAILTIVFWIISLVIFPRKRVA